ncbi:MAG: hypothetical protein V3S98_04715 [Dehalococcoidia bacterium]
MSQQAADGVATDAVAHECHDCGEVFGPGVSTAPCVERGHYVGPVADCELPDTSRGSR